MAKLEVKAGTTSKILRLFVQDSSQTTISGLTGLTNTSASLTCFYIKEGDAATTQVFLVPATVGTYTASGFIQVDSTNMPGIYELHIPNAALASGKSTLVYLKGATNMSPTILEIELTAIDNQDSTAYGVSRLDAAITTRVPSGAVVLGSYSGGQDPYTLLSAQGYTSTRATKLDNLDAAVSTRSTYAGTDTAGTATLLSRLGVPSGSSIVVDMATNESQILTRLTAARATNLDNLDVAVSTRQPSGTAIVGGYSSGITSPGETSILNRIGVPSGATIVQDMATDTALILAAAGTISVSGTTVNVTDPLTNSVPGLYAVGTAGYALGTIIPAPTAGDRNVLTSIDFGPFTSKPNSVGNSTAVSGVVIKVFRGNGSTAANGTVIYQTATGRDGRASIVFNQLVEAGVGWSYTASYPAGSYDSSQPNYSMVLFNDLNV